MIQDMARAAQSVIYQAENDTSADTIFVMQPIEGLLAGIILFSQLSEGIRRELEQPAKEHFNENYMESNTFPKATFKGKVTGLTAEQAKTPGTYAVEVTGDLTIHGVSKPVTTKGSMTVEAGGVIKAKSEFNVKPEDHGIEIPGVVRKNIAEEIQVRVSMDYQKM